MHRLSAVPAQHTTSQNLFLSLAILAEYPLSINSPSGLSLTYDKKSLWTVSDRPGGSIYNIDFEGRLIKSLKYSGTDMEGVASSDDDGSVFVHDTVDVFAYFATVT